MESKQERKDAIRSYKERQPPRGVFALHCAATGRVWVGSSANLEAVKNRTWFGLRNGTHPDAGLQREWREQGEASFGFEILERLDDDVSSWLIPSLLAEKMERWMAERGARPLR